MFWLFLLDCNKAAENKKCSAVSDDKLNAPLKSLTKTLRDYKKMIEEFPPEDMSRRYGNPAFRRWHAKVVETSVSKMELVNKEHAEELATYLSVSFGNHQRLDYGTGHELSFFILLYALKQCGVVQSNEDLMACVLHVFKEYLNTAHAVQVDYKLEPAGSRGAWGLDDYSFLPFVFGSAQLLDNSKIPTNFFDNNPLIEKEKRDFLYLDAVSYVNEYKTGIVSRHSPMLYDIGQVRGGWPKINQGMLKMYKAEVCGKYQIMQHSLFGELFKFPEMQLRDPVVIPKVVSGGPVGNVNVDEESSSSESDDEE